MDLGDFVGNYNEATSDAVMQNLEFVNLGFNEEENTSKLSTLMNKRQLFTHQELISRSMKLFDKLLLFHRPGTGKTCSFTAAADDLLNDPDRKMDRVLIITNSALVADVEDQIQNKCTNGQNFMSGKYIVTTPYIFARYVYGILEKEKKHYQSKIPLSEEETNTLLYLQTFFDKGKIEEEKLDDTEMELGKRSKMQFENFNSIKSWNNSFIIYDEVQSIRNKRSGSDNFIEAFFNHPGLEYCKFVVSSGTPMINDETDIIAVLNLILNVDNKIDIKEFSGLFTGIDSDSSLKKRNYEETIFNYLKGKIGNNVSFVKELNPGIDIEYVTNPKFKSEDLYKIEMSKLQLEKYNLLKSTNDPAGGKKLALCNFYSKTDVVNNNLTDFYKDILIRSKVDVGKRSVNTEAYKFKKESDYTLDKLEEVSTKMYELVKLLNTVEGKCFVFTPEVSSGTNLITACLQANKWNYYHGRSDRSKGSNTFCVVTGDTDKKLLDKIIRDFNAEDNVHGEKIKVLIGSEVISTGFSLDSVVNAFIINSFWNSASLYQALGRIFRVNSYIRLKKEHSEKNLPKVKVRIYKMVSVLPSKNLTTSIDEDLYIRSKEKDRRIKLVERCLKRLAFDCGIQYKRNNTNCDYLECDYKCDIRDDLIEKYNQIKPESLTIYKDPLIEMDYNTNPPDYLRNAYNTYYSTPLEENIITYIKESINGSMSISELIDKFKSADPVVIFKAIDNLVRNKHYIQDRLGVIYYPTIQDDKIYLTNNPTNNGVSNDFFFNKLMFVRNIVSLAVNERTLLAERCIREGRCDKLMNSDFIFRLRKKDIDHAEAIIRANSVQPRQGPKVTPNKWSHELEKISNKNYLPKINPDDYDVIAIPIFEQIKVSYVLNFNKVACDIQLHTLNGVKTQLEFFDEKSLNENITNEKDKIYMTITYCVVQKMISEYYSQKIKEISERALKVATKFTPSFGSIYPDGKFRISIYNKEKKEFNSGTETVSKTILKSAGLDIPEEKIISYYRKNDILLTFE